MPISRRHFLTGLAAAAVTGRCPPTHAASSRARVLVIGGGFAGATAAKYLRKWGAHQSVTLLERRPRFVSCPLSNLVLGGSRTIEDLSRSYDDLIKRYAVDVVHGEATAVDHAGRIVTTNTGTELAYDRLVLAPGIDFDYRAIPGLQDPSAQAAVLHGWIAGEQTRMLRKRLERMPNGGVVVITVPPAPFRCPPGPYERACQIAFYLKFSKPRSKVLVLDANREILVKRDFFLRVWEEKYRGLIEYIPDSPVLDVDLAGHTVQTPFGDVRADVLNIIPPQRAGKIAQMAGVVPSDGDWCEVDFLTYESTLQPGIHIIGDAVSSTMPKSAHIANAQAKVCANAISALTQAKPVYGAPVFANTCYSWISASEAMHVTYVYRFDPQTRKMWAVEGGGVSGPPDKLDAYYARAWAENLWQDTLG